MYGIYTNIWGILMVNVTIFGIHTDPMGFETTNCPYKNSIEQFGDLMETVLLPIIRNLPTKNMVVYVYVCVYVYIYMCGSGCVVGVEYQDDIVDNRV